MCRCAELGDGSRFHVIYCCPLPLPSFFCLLLSIWLYVHCRDTHQAGLIARDGSRPLRADRPRPAPAVPPATGRLPPAACRRCVVPLPWYRRRWQGSCWPPAAARAGQAFGLVGPAARLLLQQQQRRAACAPSLAHLLLLPLLLPPLLQALLPPPDQKQKGGRRLRAGQHLAAPGPGALPPPPRPGTRRTAAARASAAAQRRCLHAAAAAAAAAALLAMTAEPAGRAGGGRSRATK